MRAYSLDIDVRGRLICEPPHGLDIVQYAIAEIAQRHGELSIRALSDHIGISQNHLGTQFKRLVGIPPKEMARFYRFASPSLDRPGSAGRLDADRTRIRFL